MAARPLVARQPNERLQALIQEAGCSNAGLARRVNMCGAEHGLDLRYDKTSVARWLRGQQPRGRAPAIIAEALGRKLGRTVTIDEIGMANGKNLASGRRAPVLADRPRGDRAGLRAVAQRRRAARLPQSGSTVAASALVEPSRDWLITGADTQVARTAGARVGHLGRRGGAGDDRRRSVDLDHRFGSGHVRPVVVHYLNSVVSGLLAGSYRESVGRELFAAVARLTELAGYMAVDTGQPGLAQRYYIQALRLAQAAGDRGYGGYVLAASMSHLAAQLGNPREIAQLARAAQEGARGQVTPRAEAMFCAAEARGHALMGDAPGLPGAWPGGRSPRWSAAEAAADAGDDPVVDRATSTRPIWPTNWPTATGTWARPRPRRAARAGGAGRASRRPGAAPGHRAAAAGHGAGAAARGGAGLPHGHAGGGAAGRAALQPGRGVSGRLPAASGAVPGRAGGAGVRGAAGAAGHGGLNAGPAARLDGAATASATAGGCLARGAGCRTAPARAGLAVRAAGGDQATWSNVAATR